MKENIYSKLQNILLIMSENNNYNNYNNSNIENKIQQNIGMLTIIDIMPLHKKKLYKKLILNCLKKLYKQKKELLYGYNKKTNFKLVS